MTADQINILKEAARFSNTTVPVAFIADSPWIPLYCGHGFVDYYANDDLWLADNRKIAKDFPGAIFVPGWWVEYGMAAEPSGFGCPMCFFDDNLPHMRPLTEDLEGAGEFFSRMQLPDPRRDGVMPLTLSKMRHFRPLIEAEGHKQWMVCARGPFTVASHLFTVTQLLMLMMTDPDAAATLLRKTTDCVKLWLEAQLQEAPDAGAIMVLDDVCGFFSPDDFKSLCLPYMKEVFDAFPGMLHFFHNDYTSDSCYPSLAGMGVDVFNLTHEVSISRARSLAGGRTALMGNVPPMLLVDGTPEAVYDAASAVIKDYVAENGSVAGLILSTGGGLPMGAKKENIDALLAAGLNA